MSNVYEQLAKRTNGDVYIGVVGPVRIGKSTLVKKIMEHLVLPNIVDEDERRRALDELPQSSPGPVIMTAEPKFVPAKSTEIKLSDQDVSFRIRLADCVGYVIDGVRGYEDENGPRLVQTPWHTELIPFVEAAKMGTDKVIRDHANIGIVLTTDGTVNGISREAASVVEEQLIQQLQEIGKPFVIVVNSAMPAHEQTMRLRNELYLRYEVPVHAVSVEHLTKSDIAHILEEALYEFPLEHIEVEKPDWIDALDEDHVLISEIAEVTTQLRDTIQKMRDVEKAVKDVQVPCIERGELLAVDAGNSRATIRLYVKPEYYRAACNEWLQEPIETKREWLLFLKESAQAKKEQAMFKEAIEDAKKHGYGATIPVMEDFVPSEPELIKQNNFYGVKMLAEASSYHVIRVDMNAEFAPLIGSQFHSQQLLKDLTYAYHHDREALWKTQLFGTPLFEVLKESIRYKVDAVPSAAKERMRKTIERMVNEGDRGIVTFVI